MVTLHQLENVYKFLVALYYKFNQHNGFLLAAGIAFFTLFSLFPLLLFTGIALGFVLENPNTRDQIFDYVLTNFPALADFVRVNIEALIEARSSAGIIALLGLLWAGTNLFGSLALGLNAVYEIKETRHFVQQKLVSIVVFLIIISLILISFGSTSAASVFRDEVLSLFFPERVVDIVWTVFSILISISSTFLLFLTVYWLVPNVKLTFSNIWIGTLTAGIVWEAAKYIFAIYLNTFARTGYGFVYGSLASIILLMFWLYISSVLLLIGAEINVAYERWKMGGAKVFEPRKVSEDIV